MKKRFNLYLDADYINFLQSHDINVSAFINHLLDFELKKMLDERQAINVRSIPNAAADLLSKSKEIWSD